jgi:hypothetical protein
MAYLDRSVVTLRIFGDTLDPERISRLLGGVPTESFRKGETKPSKIRNLVRKSGGWLLGAKDQEPGNVDVQVEEILGQLTHDLSVWAAISSEYKVDLFCGFFMEETDEGIEITAKNLKALGERGIKIGICIYAPLKDVAADDPCPCKSGRKYIECCAPRSTAKNPG